MSVTTGALVAPSVIRVSVPGLPGPAAKQIEMRKTATHIQWHYVGEADWFNLIALSEITGPTGGQGGSNVDLSEYAKIVDVNTLVNSRVPLSRTVTAGSGLTGGGDLSANRTLTVNFGTANGTVTQGNDFRLSDARVPTDGSVTTAKIVNGAITTEKIADGTITNVDISTTAAIAVAKIAGLANVAKTGSYNDLVDVPTINNNATTLVQDPDNPDLWVLSGSAPVGGTVNVSDATASVKGIIQLNGDLGGTAGSPTVPGLVNKVSTTDSRLSDPRNPIDASVTSVKLADNSVIASKIPDGTITSAKILDGTITNADIAAAAAIAVSKITGLATVATTGSYVDLTNKPTIPSVIDATTSVKGIIQLAGDLSGTSALPTVANGSITSAKIAAGTITNANIASAAAIAVSKISGLSSVALTGSYNDLLDKPTVTTPADTASVDSANTDVLIINDGVVDSTNSDAVVTNTGVVDSSNSSLISYDVLATTVFGDGINNIRKMTQSAYDALGTKDATTLYVVSG